MDKFITDLVSDACQKTLGINSDVVAIASGIAVLRDHEKCNWLLCFDIDRWQKRNALYRQTSQSSVFAATEHFLIGIVDQWPCAQIERPDIRMRKAAFMMLVAVRNDDVKTLEFNSVQIYTRAKTRS